MNTQKQRTIMKSFVISQFGYCPITQFAIFKLLSYCFEEIIGFKVKVSFARRPVSRLMKPGDVTHEF